MNNYKFRSVNGSFLRYDSNESDGAWCTGDDDLSQLTKEHQYSRSCSKCWIGDKHTYNEHLRSIEFDDTLPGGE